MFCTKFHKYCLSPEEARDYFNFLELCGPLSVSCHCGFCEVDVSWVKR